MTKLQKSSPNFSAPANEVTEPPGGQRDSRPSPHSDSGVPQCPHPRLVAVVAFAWLQLLTAFVWCTCSSLKQAGLSSYYKHPAR